MRLFLALDLPSDRKRTLAGLQRRMKSGRPVQEEAMHITVRFLGEDVDEDAVEELDTLISAKRFTAPEIRLTGIGHFGTAGIRAIWMGVAMTPDLQALYDRTQAAARRAGIALKRRRFVPHVTLARYRDGDLSAFEDLAIVSGALDPVALPAFTPPAMVLYRSHLLSGGPHYEALAEYPLFPRQ